MPGDHRTGWDRWWDPGDLWTSWAGAHYRMTWTGAGDSSGCGWGPRPWEQIRLSRKHMQGGAASRRGRREDTSIPQARAVEKTHPGMPTMLPAQGDKSLKGLFSMSPPSSAEWTWQVLNKCLDS